MIKLPSARIIQNGIEKWWYSNRNRRRTIADRIIDETQSLVRPETVERQPERTETSQSSHRISKLIILLWSGSVDRAIE